MKLKGEVKGHEVIKNMRKWSGDYEETNYLKI